MIIRNPIIIIIIIIMPTVKGLSPQLLLFAQSQYPHSASQLLFTQWFLSPAHHSVAVVFYPGGQWGLFTS